MTTWTPHPPSLSEGRAPKLSRPVSVGGGVPAVPEGELPAGSKEGRASQGSPTPRRTEPPARPRWAAGPGRAARPLQDWLPPRDITRLGESASVSASRSHSAGSCGRSRGRPSHPVPAPGPQPGRPAARPARWPTGRPPVPPSVRCEGSGRRCLVSDFRGGAGARGGLGWGRRTRGSRTLRSSSEAGPTGTGGPQASLGRARGGGLQRAPLEGRPGTAP